MSEELCSNESLMSDFALKNPQQQMENVQVTVSKVHAYDVHYANNHCLNMRVLSLKALNF
jgi:hypothetical protein